jgi:hypothetical protein
MKPLKRTFILVIFLLVPFILISQKKDQKTTSSRFNASFTVLGQYGRASLSAELLKPNIGFEIPFDFLYDSELQFSGFLSGLNINYYPFKNNKWVFIGPSFNVGILINDKSRNAIFVLASGLNLGVLFQLNKWFGIFAKGSSHLFIATSTTSDALASQLNAGISITLQ